MQKKPPVQIQAKHAGENIHQMPLDLRKTRAEWRNMLQNMLPHPTPGERDSFLMFFLIFVGARPSANKNVDVGGEEW